MVYLMFIYVLHTKYVHLYYHSLLKYLGKQNQIIDIICLYTCTVKPVLRCHLWDKEKVA